jgi:hypothetical protein
MTNTHPIRRTLAPYVLGHHSSGVAAMRATHDGMTADHWRSWPSRRGLFWLDDMGTVFPFRRSRVTSEDEMLLKSLAGKWPKRRRPGPTASHGKSICRRERRNRSPCGGEIATLAERRNRNIGREMGQRGSRTPTPTDSEISGTCSSFASLPSFAQSSSADIGYHDVSRSFRQGVSESRVPFY